MSDVVAITERRSAPRYAVFRGCSIIAAGTITEVTILNLSRNGIATLGPGLPVTPGERVTYCIEGVPHLLEAVAVNVSYGRIGARFDLTPDAAADWAETFRDLLAEAAPLD